MLASCSALSRAIIFETRGPAFFFCIGLHKCIVSPALRVRRPPPVPAPVSLWPANPVAPNHRALLAGCPPHQTPPCWCGEMALLCVSWQSPAQGQAPDPEAMAKPAPPWSPSDSAPRMTQVVPEPQPDILRGLGGTVTKGTGRCISQDMTGYAAVTNISKPSEL